MAANDLNHQEVIALVDDLVRATRSGAARWEEGDEAGDSFLLATGGGIVQVEAVGKSDHPFVLRIFDEDDRKMYEVRTEVAPFYSPAEEQIARLFAAAKNSVYDVSGTVRRIRSSLGL